MDTSFLMTVGGTTSFDDVIQKPAQTITVNNYSNQWVELPQITAFVPPYWVGATYPAGGTNRAIARFASPTGIPQAATIAQQTCVVIYSEIAMNPNPGQPITVRAPSGERRNPLGVNLQFFSSNVAPHGGTNRWVYTVPVGRRAFIEELQGFTELEAAGDLAVTNLVGFAETGVSYTPSGSSLKRLLDANVQDLCPSRSRADVALGFTMELSAGEVIAGFTDNFYTATPATHFIGAKLTEADA